MVKHIINGIEFEVNDKNIECKAANLVYSVKKDGTKSYSQKGSVPVQQLNKAISALDILLKKLDM